ncbi:restriction endonuclease subunit S [Frankia sp. QA3]|uniref:restriction endonuclease subunit S n=1 Tax=Frankia sp. QA3 TaxID=710111 RepID=UPI000269B9CC|nr:restriction endonuclease subunit S [Frankia sp. QA3]EIV90845.1 restriction endonuclease S subunit [Frankia sp. QA3]
MCDVLAGPAGAASSGGGNSSGVPVIKPRNISENRIVRDRLDFVEPAAAGMLDRYRLASGDVACTRTGEIGRGALVTEEHDGWLLGTSCLRLRPGPALDPSYLIFYLGHPRVQRWLVGNAGGSTVRSLTAATMRALPLLLPDNDRQRRIGAAMSALDEQLAIHDRIRRSTSALRESLVPLYLEDSLLDEAPGKIMSPLPFGHPASRQSVPCCRPPGSVSVAHRLPAGTDANIITNKVHYSRP